jgi:mycofactocin precursor peptide peptidase
MSDVMELSAHRYPALPGAATLVVPLGSVEQHGPHLPLGTDGMIAEALCRIAVSRLNDHETGLSTNPGGHGNPSSAPAHRWMLGPLIPFGSSGEHESFPGTVSVGHPELGGYLVELARSATRWCSRIRVVTGHGGNAPSLLAACRLLAREGRDVAWTGLDLPGADAHAGHTETSLMLHLTPALVRMDLAAPGRTDPLDRLLPELMRSGVQAVSPTGVLGDPTSATSAEGARLTEQLAGLLVHRLVRGHPDEGGHLR